MQQLRDQWGSRVGFVLAASGSAIGLGNLWKFPYITWDNHGGAFVLVYLVCIALIGLPIMMTEILIGRKTQKSAVGALKEAAGPAWGLVGGLGVLTGFVILGYYTVIAGWSLRNFVQCMRWSLTGFPEPDAAVNVERVVGGRRLIGHRGRGGVSELVAGTDDERVEGVSRIETTRMGRRLGHTGRWDGDAPVPVSRGAQTRRRSGGSGGRSMSGVSKRRGDGGARCGGGLAAREAQL